MLTANPKPMGRPPLPPEKRKVRLHISVAPDIAAKALAYTFGVSKFFEHAVKRRASKEKA